MSTYILIVGNFLGHQLLVRLLSLPETSLEEPLPTTIPQPSTFLQQQQLLELINPEAFLCEEFTLRQFKPPQINPDVFFKCPVLTNKETEKTTWARHRKISPKKGLLSDRNQCSMHTGKRRESAVNK